MWGRIRHHVRLWTVVTFTLAACLAAGCTGGGPAPVSPTSPSVTTSTAATDLTLPGMAQHAVDMLQGEAGGRPIIRVTVSPQEATLTYVDKGQAVTWSWSNGAVAVINSPVTYVDQASFNPASFSLDDVGSLFARAAAVSGSNSQQELQINEYNQGKVLMTVTTSPESQTVFFRPNGTMIDALDLTTGPGLAEALADITGGVEAVVGIGLLDGALWADIRLSDQQVEHRVRPAKLPAYTVLRTDRTKVAPFSPALVQPQVIASILADVAANRHVSPNQITLTMDTRDDLGYAALRFTTGVTTVVYTPDGIDITAQIAR
ncbi:MAG: hypothetical protein FWC46_03495 [Actinomycetia bacterium]|nr:hypothetical protein [Actinomycetes bacterium]